VGHSREGNERAVWQDDESRTTVLLLVKGGFRVDLSVDSFVLEREGDYATWGPGSLIPGEPRRTQSWSR
jgi:hypothetical protein